MPGPVKKGNYVRRRSPSPGPSSTAATPSTSTPSSQPSKSAASKLLQSTLHQANTSRTNTPPATIATPDSNRVQFEQQEDFISFDLSPSPPPSNGRATPRDRDRNGRNGGKRKHDDDDKQEEGTRQLRKREKERSTPWCDEPGVAWSSYDSATAQLNAEARSFISYISPTPVEHELRMWTIEIIRRTIKSQYADADVQCFGSVGTGLYLPGGDIDLVVLCPSMPSPPLKPSSSLLHRLASLLLTSSIAQPSSLVVIAKARVPIVKFTTRYGGFAVDLSVNQKNGVDAAVRVRGMLEDFAFREEGYVEPGGGISIKGKANASSSSSGKGKGKRPADEDEDDDASDSLEDLVAVDHGVARSLVLLVKAFLSQRAMNEVFTGGLGSYSIICLVISFLQLHPKIQSAQIQPSRNIGLLFLEFLEYYGKHFNFDEAGITLKGRGGYFNKHDKGWFRNNQPYLLSIEDPNDPQNDVSGGSHNIIRVRQTLAGGFDTLSATLLQRHSHLKSKRNSALVPLSSASLPNADSDPPSAGTRSLLGSIIGMPRADVEAREANVRLWRDGVLQNVLERTGDAVEGGGGSKKAMKRARKEERERQRREKTVAKLERRIEEKEKKALRKRERKKEGRTSRDEMDVERDEDVVPVVDPKAVEEAKAAAASLKGLAGPDEDSGYTGRKTASRQDDDDGEEEESRYSLGVPAISRKSRNPSPRPVPVYTASSSDDDDDAEDDDTRNGDEDDGDVIVGGGGGDFVRFDSAQGSVVDEDEDDEDGSDSSSSGREVVQSLVPPSKRAKVEADRPKPAPRADESTSKKGKKTGGKASDAKKKAKAAAKAAYWGAKGPKEP
ncbi:hypothetical protein JCM10212_006290 [Sporobolomyces blumeae]